MITTFRSPSPVNDEVDAQEEEEAGEALFIFFLNTKHQNYFSVVFLPLTGLQRVTDRAGSTRLRRR